MAAFYLIAWVPPIGMAVLVIINSKRRLGYYGWEWAIFSVSLYSLYSMLLADILTSWYSRLPIAEQVLLFLVGAGLIYTVFLVAERHKREPGTKWNTLRKVASVVLAGSYLLNILSAYVIPVDSPYGWLLGLPSLFGFVLFVVAQFGIGRCRKRILGTSSVERPVPEDSDQL